MAEQDLNYLIKLAEDGCSKAMKSQKKMREATHEKDWKAAIDIASDGIFRLAVTCEALTEAVKQLAESSAKR